MCTMHQGSASVNSGSHQLFDVVGFDHLGQPQMTVGESLTLQAAISRSLGFNANPSRLIAAVVPSGSEKLGNLEPEASSERIDAASAADDSDATNDTEDAAESNLVDDSEADAEPTYRIVVMEGSGDVKILPGRFTYDDARQWEEAFDQPVYLATELPAPAGDYEAAPAFDSRARFIQSAVRSQLGKIRGALSYVNDSGDIGLLAMSLREVAKQVDGIGDQGSINEVPDDWGFDEAMGPEGWDNDDLKAALGLESEVHA